MKVFIKTFFLFGIVTILALICVAYIIDFSGWSDWAYKRLKSSGEKSLILGTSRAAQGILPNIIEKELSGYGFTYPIYNFSFTGYSSPYGEVYFDAIKQKLTDEDYDDGLFILSVDPWSLSLNRDVDKDHYRELDECLAGTKFYMSPNFLYLWKYARPIKYDSNLKLNDNGWLEVNVPMDSNSVRKRHESSKKIFNNVVIKKSEYRLEWLSKTISFLKHKGTVFLVRIPASIYFLQLENSFWPNFEEDITKLSKKEGVSYISFNKDFGKYRTTEGNHLYKEDGAIFTKNLCDSIKTRMKN